MGVQGLWQVLEPAGKPVDINSLRGKVFAIDVSIWLHQAVKGYRDKDGNPLPNAHLLGVFFRVCKLLNYGIKPVFVFDGGVPVLKRQTMSLRKNRKIEAMDKSESSRKKLITNFLQQEIQRQTRQALPPALRMASVIEKLASPTKGKIKSPAKSNGAGLEGDSAEDLAIFRENWSGITEDDGERFCRSVTEESDSEDSDDYNPNSYSRDYSENFSSIMSQNFDNLPLETQHEILFEMQESKKNNSWGKIHQMPQELQSFSNYQMDRLVKRRTLQKKIQQVQKEMGQRHIHVQNLDDLIKLNYDFDENKSEVISSQEGGFVLVKAKPGVGKIEDKNGQKSQEVSPTKLPIQTGSEVDCITLDSDEDSMESTSINNQSKKTDSKLLSVKEDKDLTVDEKLSPPRGSIKESGFSKEMINTIVNAIETTRKAKNARSMSELPGTSTNFNEPKEESDNVSNIVKHLVSSIQLPGPSTKRRDKTLLNKKVDEALKMNLSPEKGVDIVSNFFNGLRARCVAKEVISKLPMEVITLDEGDEDETFRKNAGKVKNIVSQLASSVKVPIFSPKKFDNDFSNIDDMNEDEQLKLALRMSLESSALKSTNSVVTPEKDVPSNNTTSSNDNNRIVPTKKVISSLPEDFQIGKASSVAKFLDTVGFSERMALQKSSQKENSCSSSDDDFEEVTTTEFNYDSESNNTTSTPIVPSENTISRSEEGTNINEPNKAVVLTIDISKNAEQPGEDMFADIFETEEIPKMTQGNNSNSRIELTEDNLIMDIDGEENDSFIVDESFIDSDSNSSVAEKEDDEEVIKSMPLVTDKSQGLPLQVVSEAKPVENGTDTTVTTTSESVKPSTSSNQKISRTLGTMPNNRGVTMITADYMQAQQKLNTEQSKLQQSKGFQERIATSITDQMYIEAQELLTLFGIPYVISPMEAESQCAFFDTACLTDGTITDDSDVWLFGGRRVYKNFFSHGDKHVELFQYADIVRILSLDREKLVLVAMLTGSDYTEGVEGVGPVTALEILSEFVSNNFLSFESLLKFREWWDSARAANDAYKAENKLKEKFRKLNLRPGFPNKAVYDAYLEPTIDTSTEPFKWGNPDLDALREFSKTKFGWDQNKCDSTLLPVTKNLRCQANEISRQMTLDKFLVYKGINVQGTSKRKLKSQRLARAVKKIKRTTAGELKLSSSESDDDEEKKTLSKQTAKAKKSTMGPETSSTSTSRLAAGISKSNVPLVPLKKKPEVIPQKVQDETNRQMNKVKAIEAIKKKKLNQTSETQQN